MPRSRGTAGISYAGVEVLKPSAGFECPNFAKPMHHVVLSPTPLNAVSYTVTLCVEQGSSPQTLLFALERRGSSRARRLSLHTDSC